MNRPILFLGILFLFNLFQLKLAYAELVDPTQSTMPTSLNNEFGQNSESNKNNMQLDAIIYSRIHPVVIINGSVLSMNEAINGYVVKEIDRQSVVLSALNGKQIILKLDTLDVKKYHSGKLGN
jgi:type II secretory pathway component PulC